MTKIIDLRIKEKIYKSRKSQISILNDFNLEVITSVAKDRKAPSGGKSRTREADDAAIFA